MLIFSDSLFFRENHLKEREISILNSVEFYPMAFLRRNALLREERSANARRVKKSWHSFGGLATDY